MKAITNSVKYKGENRQKGKTASILQVDILCAPYSAVRQFLPRLIIKIME